MKKISVDKKAAACLPEDLIRARTVLPIALRGKALTVLVPEMDKTLIAEIRFIAEKDIIPQTASRKEITALIEKHLGYRDSIRNIVQKSDIADAAAETVEDDSSPAAKILTLMLEQAVKKGASDIHIEMERTATALRYRIDGVLADEEAPPKALYPNIISRIKVLAKLDIAEKRLPQDGKFVFRSGSENIDVRVSIIPAAYGEHAALRILSQKGTAADLLSLGFDESERAMFASLIREPMGLMLITGPTGSGKTTTLYALLNEIKDRGRKIISIEDPVEYAVDGVMQIPVNDAIGFSFSAALKRILRHDPNVILIGEIRDRDTASIAANAALTGHLVLGTMHTNSAATALTRLKEFGVNNFLISEVVRLITAQRLVRTICPDCGGKKTGCECMTGYRGRTAIAEFLPADEAVRHIMQDANAGEAELNRYMKEKKFPRLIDRGMDLIKRGVTTDDEIRRVVGSDGI